MADNNDNPVPNNSENASPPQEECTSPSCCSDKKDKNKTAKWALFAIIMLAAIAIGSTTLIRKMNAAKLATATPCCPPGECKEGKKSCAELTQALCGSILASMDEFNRLAGNKSVAFILLPGDDREKAKTVATNVNGFIEKSTKGRNDIAVFTLEKKAEGHDQLVNNFGIKSFPSVVVLGRGCKASAISDDFTEEKFSNALTVARTPTKSCCPGH